MFAMIFIMRKFSTECPLGLSFYVKFLILSVFWVLVSPVQALQCDNVFSKDHPTSKSVLAISRDRESPMYSHLTARNVSQLFKHNYSTGDPLLFGCKAVVVFLPGWKTPQVYFFATGENSKSWNMHHANAASAVLGDNILFYLNLRYMQGYELTAKKFDGRWRITSLDIQSAITNLQRDNEKHRPSLEAEEQMLKALLDSIDPDLVSFSIPEL